MYLNHPGKSELKEHSGVRRIQDWGGIFENARQEKDKIFADLRVREAYWDLVQDVATMSPANVGHSIPATRFSTCASVMRTRVGRVRR